MPKLNAKNPTESLQHNLAKMKWNVLMKYDIMKSNLRKLECESYDHAASTRNFKFSTAHFLLTSVHARCVSRTVSSFAIWHLCKLTARTRAHTDTHTHTRLQIIMR